MKYDIDYDLVGKLLKIGKDVHEFPNLTALQTAVKEELHEISKDAAEKLSALKKPALPGQPVKGANSPDDVSNVSNIGQAMDDKSLDQPTGLAEGQNEIPHERLEEDEPGYASLEDGGPQVEQPNPSRRV